MRDRQARVNVDTTHIKKQFSKTLIHTAVEHAKYTAVVPTKFSSSIRILQ